MRSKISYFFTITLANLFTSSDYLAQMAHFAWAFMLNAMFCHVMHHQRHWVYSKSSILFAIVFMAAWATPKEWIYDTIYEHATWEDNLLDWSMYLAGSVVAVVWMIHFN